ncbi:pyridoxal phosphate-dependent aminotransferase [Methanonatronarchaeum sp. AMET6-2]|uniref:pyridoxal phosphate-dependent aminotransferase n=1 Tax=Methanonatronarchaeum sp. AMET6-2 TaxID=2933293 RepID=UPI0012232739|nr:aminotransferase class I/II-fold pyridoxal phosphate-dependent enzyme [Methanonatronarchaeum sp. AMET6-2]RZN60854.1 MAG: aminotransferase class I/II-fold pyridoxal phosphate-dependent enzyme [Methanonatronarchaeia archaeon]UOY09552.1 aminotransferase class I/II-fold pyridoxal phosphate-dependent enzyme [Methanonatronarchaeum sp. AMET6-2]
MKISSRLSDVPPSGIREFFELVLNMDSVISLGVGEPDFVTPWRIREAGIYSLETGYTSYTSNKGLLELRELVAGELDGRCAEGYDPEEEVLITTGVSEAFDLAVRAVVDPGDEVIVFEPSYVSYSPCVKFSGGVTKTIQLDIDDGFVPDPGELREAVNSDTALIVLNNPNNPTGSCLDGETAREIADISREFDVPLLCDEIYSKLVYDGEHVSPLDYDGMKERCILLDGFSKSHAMTGWRIGYAAGPSDVISAMNKIHQYTMLCAPIVSQKAAVEAVENCSSEVSDMVSEYNRRRRLVYGRFNQMGLECPEPGGAFYVFPSIRETGLSSEEFSKRLLEEEKVAVVPGTAFGEAGEGHIRCSYANSKEVLKEALDRIERFVGQYL